MVPLLRAAAPDSGSRNPGGPGGPLSPVPVHLVFPGPDRERLLESGAIIAFTAPGFQRNNYCRLGNYVPLAACCNSALSSAWTPPNSSLILANKSRDTSMSARKADACNPAQSWLNRIAPTFALLDLRP